MNLLVVASLFLPKILNLDFVNQEALGLKDKFQQEVSALNFDQSYVDWAGEEALARLKTIPWSLLFSQYFVFIDRHPDQQNIMVGFFNAISSEIIVLGWDKTSTGKPERRGHYQTPVGIFRNSIDNIGYRALGTKNSKGWRGLGKKGSRVWDFGWQTTERIYQRHEEAIDIRLLLHATDPDFGEPRLGKVDSKGCVRISAKLNKFLDEYGILDADFEANKKLVQISWLLRPDRQTVKCPGRYLLVADSTGLAEPATKLAKSD